MAERKAEATPAEKALRDSVGHHHAEPVRAERHQSGHHGLTCTTCSTRTGIRGVRVIVLTGWRRRQDLLRRWRHRGS